MTATASPTRERVAHPELTMNHEPGTTTVTFSRIFNAPRELVWRAYTEPAMLAAWYGPRYLTSEVETFDLRPGGAWRIIQRSPDGQEYGFHGVFLELDAPRLIRQTWVFEGYPDSEFIESAEFTDLGDGRTLFTGSSTAPSAAAVEGMLAGGMMEGAVESYERLDEILADPGSLGRSIILRRTVDAPRALVWKAWTDPALLVNWWGPDGFSNTFHAHDFREGGEWRFTMHGPDGVNYPNLIVFDEVDAPRLIAYTHGSGVADEEVFRTRVTFTDGGEQTHLTMHIVLASDEEMRRVEEMGAVASGNQTLNRMEAAVAELKAAMEAAVGAGMHAEAAEWSRHDWGEPLYSRSFAAKRELVWQTLTEPQHLAQWWGPAGMELHVHKLELRPGGHFYYSSVAANGATMWGRFVYYVIAAPERLEFINSFSDESGGVTRAPFGMPWPQEIYNIWSLSEANGQTTISLRGGPVNATPEEVASYEAMRPNLAQGLGGSFDKLEEYLAAVTG